MNVILTKDYVLIAEVLNDELHKYLHEANPLEEIARLTINGLMVSFCERLAKENPNFDKAKFYEAYHYDIPRTN